MIFKSKIIFTNHGLLGTGRELRKYELVKRALIIWILKNRVNQIICVSNYSMMRLLNDYKIDKKKVCIIYNCSTWLIQKCKKIDDNKYVILGFHGRFVYFKRIDRLINVSQLLKKDYKLNNKILLIGGGPLKNFYLDYSKQKNVDLEIESFKNPQNITLSNINFLIVPSNEENFGLSVLEGIRSGILTFVFSDGGGCTEIFGEKYQWFICENELDMCNKIIHCLNHFSLIENLFISLQDYVIENFSIEKFCKSHKELYNNLCVKNKFL